MNMLHTNSAAISVQTTDGLIWVEQTLKDGTLQALFELTPQESDTLRGYLAYAEDEIEDALVKEDA